MRTDEKTFIDRLRSLAKIDDPAVVREELEAVRAEDLAEDLTRLETDEALAILRQLDEEKASDVLTELPSETARALIAELPDATIAHYLDILPMDDALELREVLPDERYEALLEVIPSEDRQEIRRLMSYPEDSAGRLMTEDFVAVGPDEPLGSIIQHIKEAPEDEYETVNDIYVLDHDRHLLGVFSLRQAIRAASDLSAREIMKTDLVTTRYDTPAEEVARQIARYGFYAMPVLDERGRMLGFFTVDDAQEVLHEAETEDVLKLAGVTGSAEAYLSLGVLQLVKRRLPWLMILFVAEFLTGTVLRHYTGQAQEGGTTMLAQLMVFIPLLIGAGGNTGSQVTTTITRALAIGDVRPRDAILVLGRELMVACIIGAALGGIGFLRAAMWGVGMGISLTVGLALPAIIIWAAAFGSFLPLLAKRLGVDPAVMCAPFIATFVDATGLIIFFEIARRVLPNSF
ncbi:MAG: magnesium transporter [Fimbriimonadaceae bacterium]